MVAMPTAPFDLTGRHALVTGGSRGIGAAIARVLAAHGARVAVHCGHDEAAASAVRDDLEGAGHAVLRADLVDADAAATLPVRARDALGALDIVVNNAGIFVKLPAPGTDPARWREDWQRTLAINLTAPALICEAAAPILAEAGGGHIVNVSSRGAVRGEPEAPAYGASKGGLNSLSGSLAIALAPQGIRVVSLAPAWVLTDMTRPYLEGPEGPGLRAQYPTGRIVAPEELAWTTLLVVSGRADSLNGAVLDLNGASHLR
jgi:NAD(P)-dependent dehydrogenase (short-subunit alcohol dehydrogenase family)